MWSLRRGIAGITTGLRTWLEDALQMVRTDTACVVLEQCGTTGKILGAVCVLAFRRCRAIVSSLCYQQLPLHESVLSPACVPADSVL